MTTLPGDWAEESGTEHDAPWEPSEGEAYSPAVVPVKVMFDETERLAPGFATFITYTLQQTGLTGLGPTQILQRRYKRFKAKFYLNFPGAGTVTINSKSEQLTSSPTNPIGFNITSAAAANNVAIPDYDGMPALYAIASIAGVTISVMDESYGQVQ